MSPSVVSYLKLANAKLVACVCSVALFIAIADTTLAQTPADWEVWRVFVPAEDVGSLVPLDYNLIEVEDLAEALKREVTRRSQVKSVGPHIAESIYVMRATSDYLVSDQCRWSVRSQQPTAKLTLQNLSVALRNSGVTPADDKSLLPNLRYTVDGTATVANIVGDTNYWFGLSASPVSNTGTQATYELTLPPATMAKMLIAVPETMVVSSPDVIVSEIDDPSKILPENWPSMTAVEGQRWYSIFLSGKSQFKLLTQVAERRDSLNYQQFVRRVNLAYDATTKGVSLAGDFEVERLSTSEPLRMQFDAPLKIRALTVDDKTISYRILDSADDTKHTIELPTTNANGRTRIRVDAYCDLDFPFEGNLPTMALERGFAWDGRTTITADDELQIEEASLLGRSELAKPRIESTTIGRRWTADWLGAVPTFAAKIHRPVKRWTASTLTRLTIQQDWIAATMNMRLACKKLRTNELRLKIGEGWFIDDLTIEQSDAQVNIQLPDGEAGDAILTWDRLNDEMEINLQIVAHLPRETDVDRFNLIAPRIASLDDGAHSDLYAIEQTGRRRIQPDPLLQRLQVRESEISDWQIQLLSQSSTSQLYRGFNDRLPPLVLNRASGSYSAKVRTVGRAQNGQLQVTHRVEMVPTAGPIESVSCLLNMPTGIAPPVWRVMQEVDGDLLQLSKAVVKANRNGADARGETRFDVQLSEATALPFVLQCELFLPLAPDGTTNVPLVTTSVATDTWLIVPRQFSLAQTTSGLVVLPSTICCEAGELAESLGDDAVSMTAYRYDPTLVSSVDLRPASRVPDSGAWVWETSTEHWLFNDGRSAHRSNWEVFAPENMIAIINMPAGWVVNRVVVNGQSISVNQPINSLKLPVPIPSGERVQLSVQSLSLSREPKWYSAVELPKPRCEIASLNESEYLMLQPGRLAFSEVFNEEPLSFAQRVLPTNLWRWMSPTPLVDSTREQEPLNEAGWRRIKLTAPVHRAMVSNGELELEEDSLVSPQPEAQVKLLDRNSLCGLCIAILLAGAGWSYTVLGTRPLRWWICLTLAGAAVLVVMPQHIIFAQLTLLSLLCGALARLVSVTTSARIPRSGSTTRRGSTVVRANSMAAWLMAVGLCSLPGQTQAQSLTQDPLKKRDATPTIYGVLIPINEEGELSAKHVYVPNKLMNLLDATEEIDDKDLQPQILNAKYTLKLRSDTSLTTSYVQEFTVEFDLLFNSLESPLRLPFLKSQLQLLRGSVAGQEIYIGQRLTQLNDEILFRPSELGRVRLRLQLIPMSIEAAGRSSFEVTIPRIASSTLDVIAGDAMDVEVKGFGAVRRLTATTWTADLGPTDVLKVNWPTRTQRIPTASQAQTQSDTWVHVHEGQVVADCQLRVSGSSTLPSQLHVMVDAAWEPVGSQWQDARCVSSELSAVGSRRIYTVNRDSLGDRMVIRALLVPRNSDGQSLSVPFFSLQENVLSSRTLALSGAGRSKWRLNGNEFWNRLTSSAADLGWDSSKPVMTDAWRVPTGSLSGTLQRIAPLARPVVDEQTELQLLSTGSQLNYRSDWSQVGDEQFAKFELPADSEVQSVMLNGIAAEYQNSQSNNRNYLLVRAPRAPADIRAIQIQLQLKSNQAKSALPRILLQDFPISSSKYQVSCGSELICSLAVDPEAAAQGLVFNRPLQDSTVMLSTLTAPVGVADLGNRFRESVYLPAQFEVKTRKPPKFVTSAMALSRSEQGWRANVEVLLAADEAVDFVFFDVPSSIRDLIESTGSPYRVSAASTAGRSTLCLLPRTSEDGSTRASFTFRLSTLGSSSSLAIPDIAFLGERSIRPVLSLPTKIDDQPVRWSRAGRRLENNWLANSGLTLASEGYVSFEVNELQQQASWRPAKVESKPAEVVFQWATIEQDASGSSIGAVNYWIQPNNHLDVTAKIPAGVEMIGLQTGTGRGIWHTGSAGDVHVLMQPSYLPVHLRLLLKWPQTISSSKSTSSAFSLEMPALNATAPRQMPISIRSSTVLVGVSGSAEQRDATEREFQAGMEATQFNSMMADRWSRLLLKTLPVVSDLDGDELSSWLRNWSPSMTSLSNSQVIPASAGTNSDFDEAERDTVEEFWDWYLGQLSDFDIAVLSSLPPASELADSTAGERASGNGFADDLYGSPGRKLRDGLLDERSGEKTWYLIKTPEAANGKLMLRFETPVVEATAMPWLFAGVLIACSVAIYIVVRRLQGKASEIVAQQPWLYWVLLAGACWLLLPTSGPSIIVAACALGMLVSQLLSTRRRQLAMRR